MGRFLIFALLFNIMHPKKLLIADFTYDLPNERIAKYPLPNRDSSKLLLYNGGYISETSYSQLPELLPEDSLLVFNDTRVVEARLFFQKSSGATIEVFCLEPDHRTLTLQVPWQRKDKYFGSA